MSVAVRAPSGGHRIIRGACSRVSDVTAAILLVADLLVVCASVLLRFLFNAPVEWADDVARGLMVGSSFFGAASALARSENLGVAFFIDMLPGGVRRVVDADGRAAGDDHCRLCRLQRHQDGLADHRADLRLRPAAGMDVLSDGRRRAVHDGVRVRTVLHASGPRHARRHRRDRHHRRPLSGVGLPVAGHRCRRRAR